MNVFFHELFYTVYTGDPAAEAGRMEAIVQALPAATSLITAEPATPNQIAAAHGDAHIADVQTEGLFPIAALAAGAAVQAAREALTQPSFALVRPPGHHASRHRAWGFCYFNNLAIALLALKQAGLIQTALVLDVDLHYGDGTVNILGDQAWVTIHNPIAHTRPAYLDEVARILEPPVDMIALSAGFDQHVHDWGGLLHTQDYHDIGVLSARRAHATGAGVFGVLEGGYNHHVLGRNVAALLEGLRAGWSGD